MSQQQQDQASLRSAVEWALEFIADGMVPEDGSVPLHACEFFRDPEKGSCDYHDNYVALQQFAEQLRGAEATRQELPLSAPVPAVPREETPTEAEIKGAVVAMKVAIAATAMTPLTEPELRILARAVLDRRGRTLGSGRVAEDGAI